MAINFLNAGQFPDSAKLNFGDSQDLEIYHNGSHSYIDETGTGSLYVRASDTVYIQKSDGSSAMAQFTAGGGCFLYHNNNLRLGTTSTGVDITGDLNVNAGTNNIAATFNSSDDTAKITLSDNDTTVYLSAKDSIFNFGLNSTVTSNENIELLLSGSKQYLGFGGAPSTTDRFKLKHDVSTNDDANYTNFKSDFNVSGSTAISADRTYRGIYSDLDSTSTSGDTSDEVRLYGIESNVVDSGDADLTYGMYSFARNNRSTAGDNVTNVVAGRFQTQVSNTAGVVTNSKGVHGSAQADNAGGTINNLYGGHFEVNQTADSDKVIGNVYGVFGKVDTTTGGGGGMFTYSDGGRFEVEMEVNGGTMTAARGVHAILDINDGTVTNGYQFYGSSAIAGGGAITNHYGIYSIGASKNYLQGTLQLASYGSGSQTGTSAYYLIADSSGNIIEKTPAEVRSDIGAGTGSGTVTSVGITAGTGISVSGSPITGSGSITVTNTAPATIDGSGAATRLAYWSDADTLTSDAGLTYDAGNHLTTTAQVRAGDGTKGAPAYSFDSDRDTGVYLEAAGDIGFTQGGNIQMRINSSGVGVYTDIFHVGDTDTKIAFTTNTITVTTGGTEAFDVVSGATRFATSTRFTANATWDDNSKALFGDDSDIQIYSDNTTAYIEMPTLSNFIIGDSTTFDTGNIALVRVAELTGTKSMEEDWMGMYTSANTGLSYMTSSGTVRIETQNSGAKVTGALTVTGDVLDRDIPCLFNSNFSDGTASNIYIVPFNSLSEATVSAKTYYHYITMPYAGKLTKIIMKNVSGSPSSGFTTQLFLYVNGSQQASSSELTISSSKIEWTPTTSNTFAAGDELSFGYQKSASSKTWSGVSFGVAIELTDYDI